MVFGSLIFAIVTSSMTQENRREFIVKGTDAGARLDRFLANSANEFSRSRIEALIRDGFVTVNGAVRVRARHCDERAIALSWSNHPFKRLIWSRKRSRSPFCSKTTT